MLCIFFVFLLLLLLLLVFVGFLLDDVAEFLQQLLYLRVEVFIFRGELNGLVVIFVVKGLVVFAIALHIIGITSAS